MALQATCRALRGERRGARAGGARHAQVAIMDTHPHQEGGSRQRCPTGHLGGLRLGAMEGGEGQPRASPTHLRVGGAPIPAGRETGRPQASRMSGEGAFAQGRLTKGLALAGVRGQGYRG